MKRLNSSNVFGALTILTVALVIMVNGPLLLNQGYAVSPPSSTSASGVSSNGLRLDFSIGGSAVQGGQTLVISVDEFNPTNAPLNVTAGKEWALDGLRINSCYASVYPFGVALYQGYYNAANVTAGKPLQIFPAIPCPLLIRLVTGYYFNPQSSKAIVLPGTSPSIQLTGNVVVSGTYPKSGLAQGTQPLSSGVYTVVAGDEWGTLLFLYFRVS